MFRLVRRAPRAAGKISGLIAQRESVRLTRGRSLVRSQLGPLPYARPVHLLARSSFFSVPGVSTGVPSRESERRQDVRLGCRVCRSPLLSAPETQLIHCLVVPAVGHSIFAMFEAAQRFDDRRRCWVCQVELATTDGRIRDLYPLRCPPRALLVAAASAARWTLATCCTRATRSGPSANSRAWTTANARDSHPALSAAPTREHATAGGAALSRLRPWCFGSGRPAAQLTAPRMHHGQWSGLISHQVLIIDNRQK